MRACVRVVLIIGHCAVIEQHKGLLGQGDAFIHCIMAMRGCVRRHGRWGRREPHIGGQHNVKQERMGKSVGE